MRRALFLLSSLTIVLAVWAGDVTPEQALKQAQNFVQNQVTAGRRAPGATPQLALKGTVSGLYVFNVADDEGFVIVSNDDRTVPVLGYSTSGSIDPDNMPANMRAWLQGYADEIAWMNEHNIQPASQSSSRRTGNSVKTPIKPLIKTQWDQDAPYNNLTPYYALDSNYNYIYSTEGGNGWSHCATGCLATAMAQVMNYHQWPKSDTTDPATTEIPEYTWQGNTLGLPPVTFDWDNMKDTYSGKETGTTATAIATLMQYCGYSVKMDYGPSSSASSPDAATALINYFGYKSTTTVLNRSWYSYANWIELIYNELLENRPVLYCGQSAKGGHAFICDGYQSEDYFHINWGWSGMSDNYFKLSALDPDEQGIGGSSSTDGYHFGQEAIVGIQKPSENGTVLNVPKNDNSITCTNMTFSANPTRYQEVTVTLTIQNTSQNDDYDGDIGLRIEYLEYIVEDIRNNFFIPKNSSKDIVITFTPEYAGTYSLRAFKPSNSKVGYIIYICNSNLVVADGEKPSTNPKKTDIYLQVPSYTMENFVQEGAILLGAGSNIVMKGNLTVYNPDETYDYDGYFEWGLRNSSNQFVSYKSTSVTIPSQGNITIPFEIDGLTNNSTYTLQFTNYRGKDANGQNVWTDWQTIQSVTTRTGIAITKADGTIELTPSETSYTAPQDALSVELTGTNVSSVTPNSNPNCLYIIDKAVSGLGGKNVITYDGDSYSATNISLTDGSDFYSPVDFTAANIEYTYDYEGKADNGKNGNSWSSIMLPYNVTKVTATSNENVTKEIDWFHSNDDNKGNFWLKEFTDDGVGTVNFDFVKVKDMKAYTPYIIAFPGDQWGTKYQMNDKTIKFIGENVTVLNGSTLSTITGSNYRFIGKTVTDGTENIYCLNADGNQFELKTSGGSNPFRAYFKADTFDRTMTSLAIGSGSGTTDIQTFEPTSKPQTDSWYTLDGRRISGQPTQKGLYIVNGKKIVIK